MGLLDGNKIRSGLCFSFRDVLWGIHIDLSSGLGSDFFSDSPIINFAGINAQLRELIDRIDGHAGSSSPVLLASLLNPPDAGNGHKPPAGYHFGATDPLGEHYMIRDGDPKNALVMTPWYQHDVQNGNIDWVGVARDLAKIGLESVSGAGGGVQSVIGIGAGVFDWLSHI